MKYYTGVGSREPPEHILILNRAFSYLYYEIAEKEVRDEIRKVDKEQKLRRNSIIDYLNN